MASHTRPFLTSGAALTSAAAIVLATPAIAPTIAASSLSASSARYELATFADVFTIPASEWVNAYFQGYGGIIGPSNDFPLEPYATQCNDQGGCFVLGPSAIAYLALDALINGNGNGWEDNDQWSVSAVNYAFEADWYVNNPGGISAGVLYLLQTSIGSANPILSTAITLAFAGPALVTIVFDNALQLLGDASLGLPLVGSYVYGAINSFLGPASLNPDYQGYFPGVTGVLNWSLDLLTGTAPTPPQPPVTDGTAPAAALAAVSAAAEATAPAAVTADAGTDAASAEAPATVAVDTGDTEPAEVTSEAESTTGSVAETVPAAETDPVAATDTAPVTAADAKAETAEATRDAGTTESAPAAEDRPAKAASKRPVRDAVAKIASSIGSALGGTTAGTATGEAGDAGSAGSADSAG